MKRCIAFLLGSLCFSQSGPLVIPGSPLPGITPAEFELFRMGREDFIEVESAGDGLGPAFNGTSCAVCHSVPAVGGISTMTEVRGGYRDEDGKFTALNGGTLYHLFSVPDHRCQVQIPAEANVIGRRAPIPLFGAGLVEAIPDETMSPNFPDFITGNQVLLTNAFASVPENAPQSFAGSDLQVMLAQLATNVGEYVGGKISIRVLSLGDSYIVSDQTWLILMPFGICCLPTGECINAYPTTCSMYKGYFVGCEPCTACAGGCLADVAPHPGDGLVNSDDLLAVIGSWGPCSQPACPADVAPVSDGDNVVDVDDLMVVINGWGPCKVNH